MIPPQFIQGIGEAAKGIIQGVFGGKGLDGLFTSKDEKLAKANELANIEAELTKALEAKMIEHAKMQFEETKAYLADTQDARMNNVKIQESDKASWLAKNIAYLLDALFVTSFILMLIMILYKQVPEENKELFYTAFGLLGGYVSTILNFHRGTSKGSEDKGKQISTMMNVKP